MLVEQAVFTSARTSRHLGYQIVARSPGVDDGLSRRLACWGPTHGSLVRRDVDGESCNYSPIDQDRVAVSRTLYGGPEYSGRGAMQVVTRFLVLRKSQLGGYDNNPVLFARAALMLGHLWLTDESPDLPRIRMPESVPFAAQSPPDESGDDDPQVQRAHRVVWSHRLALIAAEDPLSIMGSLFDRVPQRKRLELSFATGLWPSQHRLFRVHLLPELDASLRARLSRLGIRLL